MSNKQDDFKKYLTDEGVGEKRSSSVLPPPQVEPLELLQEKFQRMEIKSFSNKGRVDVGKFSTPLLYYGIEEVEPNVFWGYPDTKQMLMDVIPPPLSGQGIDHQKLCDAIGQHMELYQADVRILSLLNQCIIERKAFNQEMDLLLEGFWECPTEIYELFAFKNKFQLELDNSFLMVTHKGKRKRYYFQSFKELVPADKVKNLQKKFYLALKGNPKACPVVKALLSNIFKYPDVEKFRKIPLTNATLKAAFDQQVEDAFLELGFQKDGERLIMTAKANFQPIKDVLKIVETMITNPNSVDDIIDPVKSLQQKRQKFDQLDKKREMERKKIEESCRVKQPIEVVRGFVSSKYLSQLLQQGHPEGICLQSLIATGNISAQVAVDYILANKLNPDEPFYYTTPEDLKITINNNRAKYLHRKRIEEEKREKLLEAKREQRRREELIKSDRMRKELEKKQSQLQREIEKQTEAKDKQERKAIKLKLREEMRKVKEQAKADREKWEQRLKDR